MINSFFTGYSSLKIVNQFYSRIDAGDVAPDTPQNKSNMSYTQTELQNKFHQNPPTIQWKPEQTDASRKKDAENFLANAGMLVPEENPTPALDPKLLANATVIELPNPKESPKLDDRLLANAGVLKPAVDSPDLPDGIA
jgi:hypothetical protein